jgi:hypothetical protein
MDRERIAKLEAKVERGKVLLRPTMQFNVATYALEDTGNARMACELNILQTCLRECAESARRSDWDSMRGSLLEMNSYMRSLAAMIPDESAEVK